MPPFRILSLDGGGCRAIIESTLLDRLLEDCPTLLDEVDLFAGASAGGILSLGLAAGLSNKQAGQFYQEQCKVVFEKSYIKEIRSLDNCIEARYDNAAVMRLLEAQFGDRTLADLHRKVLIPSFQLDNNARAEVEDGCGGSDSWTLIGEGVRRWTPRFFHNMKHSTVLGERLVDIALRTSAAPTYFPIYQGYVDGGIFANNPSLCAVSTAIAAGIKLEDIVVLSLSTGRDGLYISQAQYGSGNWGLAQWAPKLADVLLDSTAEVTDYQCAQLLGDKYQRVDPPLPTNIPLDEPDKIPALEALAMKVDLEPTKKWLHEKWQTGVASDREPTCAATTQPSVPVTEVGDTAHPPADHRAENSWCVVM
eukprot:TRINITY_DN2963_c0_g1_i3.p1 TRINITY_DN2963_c0_g1~~TRINITY_DN2963_c0_g1_i3.p1  ORF type:complete len:377 (-),score=85.65 TRINITY_DN2963_c0_g1_i3:46-1137(-)